MRTAQEGSGVGCCLDCVAWRDLCKLTVAPQPKAGRRALCTTVESARWHHAHRRNSVLSVSVWKPSEVVVLTVWLHISVRCSGVQFGLFRHFLVLNRGICSPVRDPYNSGRKDGEYICSFSHVLSRCIGNFAHQSLWSPFHTSETSCVISVEKVSPAIEKTCADPSMRVGLV